MLNIYVNTCKDYAHLVPSFTRLFNKFLPGREFTVFGEDKMQMYSDQMIQFFEKLEDDHFIWMHEEFFLKSPVKQTLLAKAEGYIQKHPEVARIGLQSLYDGYENAVEPYEDGFYKLNPRHQYIFSFEASIWKKEELLKHMRMGEGVQRSETNTCTRAAIEEPLVLLTKDKVMDYKDAYRGGELRAKIENDKLLIMTQGPDGSGLWIEQNI